MTNEQKQKIQLRVSEIKQMLNRGDGPPGPFIGKQPPEVEAPTNRVKRTWNGSWLLTNTTGRKSKIAPRAGLQNTGGKNMMAHVEHKDDPVLCPKCGKKAQKTDYPFKPMPPDPPNAENMTLNT